MVVKLIVSSQKTGPLMAAFRPLSGSVLTSGILELCKASSALVPIRNRGTAMKRIRTAKVKVDPRQPYHSATMFAAEKETEIATEKEPEPLFEKEKANKKFKKGEKYLLKNVLFGFDKANIEKSSYEELNKLAQLLKEKSDKRVELSGHTDDWGPASYNQYLSEKRAQAVANYLSNKGIDKKRMVVKGYGETKPVAPNLLPNGGDNFEGRKKNRRTEIKVID